MADSSPRLSDQFRLLLQSEPLFGDTSQAFVNWAIRFIRFHRGRRPEDRADNSFRHPADMGVPEVADFLASLQTERLSLGEQARARTALLFLYARLLDIDLGEIVLPSAALKPTRLLDQVRERLRLGQYSRATEDSYVTWIRRFILFHNKLHPRNLGAVEIEAFLTHLAAERDVSASTQNHDHRLASLGRCQVKCPALKGGSTGLQAR